MLASPPQRTTRLVLEQTELLRAPAERFVYAERRTSRAPPTTHWHGPVASVRVLIVAGATETALIPGISGAGADPAALRAVPSADLELLARGHSVSLPTIPTTSRGTATPALLTHAMSEMLGVDVLCVDAGMGRPTRAPVIPVGSEPGRNIRAETALPNAGALHERARALGAGLPDEHILVGETIPGGTTTAGGVLSALGEPAGVSSSLAENPVELKRTVVDAGLAASGLQAGEASGAPMRALEAMGDPVLATVAGLVEGALEAGITVELAGGTQLGAAAALVRHAGVQAPMRLSTTAYVRADESADLDGMVEAFDLELTCTDPELETATHGALEGYGSGEVKEGVGMGGAVRLIADSTRSMSALRSHAAAIYDRLAGETHSGEPSESPGERA